MTHAGVPYPFLKYCNFYIILRKQNNTDQMSQYVAPAGSVPAARCWFDSVGLVKLNPESTTKWHTMVTTVSKWLQPDLHPWKNTPFNVFHRI